MDIKKDVVVVGAGGGGAILGLALNRKGIDTLVIEQASGPPSGVRGEILQPNGQQVLDRLGLLQRLPPEGILPVRFFHFRLVGGKRLCTIDYDMLPPPYNRALVMWPNVVHQTILEVLQAENPQGLFYGARFKSLIKDGPQVEGIEVESQGKIIKIQAKLVVGADGPFSKVREALAIPAKLHRYKESYLIAMLDCPDNITESQYFVGKRTILGVFPAARNKAYVFYMVPSDGLAQMKSEGLQSLRDKWTAIYPVFQSTFDTLRDWDQTAYMGTGRVKAKIWVTNGAVLIGDAAHGMNPHASQGRMQAMVDAVTLADIVETCQVEKNWSYSALQVFEDRRRPQVTMLQRLADEEVFFWNTGNPVLSTLRNRVFQTLDRNRRLQYQVLTATAGLRESPPFGWFDRLQAGGFWPDPRADQIPSNPQPI
ncbi:MAG: FAD-dependent monooxygenase [Nitrospirota bacterium]|nr:MAG: FAD-dependent monooxygenase [Nitrospirota bacterium]